MIRLATVLAVCAAPVAAQDPLWSFSVTFDPPIQQTYSASGDVSDWPMTETHGEVFAVVEAYFGPDEPRTATCETAQFFELSLYYGIVGVTEVQLLSGLMRGGKGWAADYPATYINIGTQDDPYAVGMEDYENIDITWGDVVCLSGDYLSVDLTLTTYERPYTDKGPDRLGATIEMSGVMPIQPYDNY